MPPKGNRGKKGKGKAAPPPEPEPVQPEPAPEEAGAKRKKTVTSFTEQEKEEIIEFLIRNEVLYSKRLAGFKDVTKKGDLWAAQAAKMNTTADQLKIWYSSMRTMMGRLKKRTKKSGSGGDAITDMNSTEKWVWDKFSFLIPHIETVDARNVSSFAAATASASDTELTSSTNQTSAVVSTSSRGPTPTLPSASPADSQSGSDGSRRDSVDRVTSGEMKELLVEFMSRSTGSCGSSYFGRYVDDMLSKLPGEIRRDAEANIMQELHRAQRAAEHNQRQPPPSQDQQAHFQFQQQSQQFQQAQWQPLPSQWPVRPAGPQPSIWGSQNRSYIQRQFPTFPMTSPLLPTTKSQPEPSRATTINTASTTLPSSEEESFVSLLSSQLNNPDPVAEDDDTDLYQT